MLLRLTLQHQSCCAQLLFIHATQPFGWYGLDFVRRASETLGVGVWAGGVAEHENVGDQRGKGGFSDARGVFVGVRAFASRFVCGVRLLRL